MQAVWTLMFCVAVLALLVCAFALIKPLPSIGLSSRKRAGLGIAWCFVTMIVSIGLAGPADTPAAASTPQAGPAAAAKPTEELVEQVDHAWAAIKSASSACDTYIDAAGRTLSNVGGSETLVSAYEDVSRAESACGQASADIRQVEPPELVQGEPRKAFRRAIEACADAATARDIAMEKMKKVVNGDFRPSAQVEAKDSIQRLPVDSARCLSLYEAAAEAVGTSLPEIEALKREAGAKLAG